MELSDFLIQPLFVALIGIPASVGLFIMYRLGHNKALLGVLIANMWLTVTFALGALNLITDEQRIVILRIGTFLLEWSFVVGGVTFVIHDRRVKRVMNAKR